MAGSIEQYSAGIAIACIIGSALSVYSYYLISRLDEDDEYEALCDFGERLSCTKTLQFESARGFGLVAPLLGSDSFFNKPNGLYGLLYYTIVSLLGLSKHWVPVKAQVVLSILAVSTSIWLLYLAVGLQNFCVICLTLFLVNIVIVSLAIIRHERLRATPASSGSSSSKGSGATKKKAAPAAKKTRSKKD